MKLPHFTLPFRESNRKKDPLLAADPSGPLVEQSGSLSDRALETMQAWIEPTLDDPIWIRFAGSCPKCNHAMETTRFLVFWGMGPSSDRSPEEIAVLVREKYRERGEEPAPVDTEFSISCQCGIAHKDGAYGGCGAMWKMRVVPDDS